MISDDEIRNLPEDPKMAFAEYANKLAAIADKEAEGRQDHNVERKFIAHIKAFADTHDIGITFPDAPADGTSFWDYYQSIRDRIEYFQAKFRLEGYRNIQAPEPELIELSDDYRSQIHHHLDRVRKVVNAAELEARLRENIFKRLNALAAEVDKNMSGLRKFTDAFLEITAAAGEGAKNLEPAVTLMGRISGILGKARKEGDVKQISKGEETKLIEGPDSSAQQLGDDLDDEIPF